MTDSTESSPDVPGRLFLIIGRLSRSLRQASAPGPGHGAISAMATLSACGRMRLGDLAAREGVAAATMSRIVSALVDAGYVHRESDPVDRRAWLVALTDEGTRLLSDVRSTRIHELSTRIERLSPEHRRSLDAAVPALEALLGDEERRD
ncbi:MarR family winged helix-turn-helix transcriptional regulator [Saccharomonospora piscinae]|uniref:MarR family transcriptional regulator n=1 Tax=Saccharomonospora piscinae TaxID=687388 RepID=A0A1V9A7W1_SACPI|nr:MarR family transcriptional regulator [Saccharomonospora piscinae]OQO93212.1 MarR family transcriptional regulator [Saccharomonospora piscinae]TLW91534.1 MarR family transcriptional regulator [Saccharomonospora piscinae]